MSTLSPAAGQRMYEPRVARVFSFDATAPAGNTRPWSKARGDLKVSSALRASPSYADTAARSLRSEGWQTPPALGAAPVLTTASLNIFRFSEATARLHERAEELVYRTAGSAALAPDTKDGWRTYNFEVDELHTYVAGGLRVHNDSMLAMNLGSAVGSFIADQLFAGNGADAIAMRLVGGAILGRLGQWVFGNVWYAFNGQGGGTAPQLGDLFKPEQLAGGLVNAAFALGGAALARGLLRNIGLGNSPVANGAASIVGGTMAQYAGFYLARDVLGMGPQTMVGMNLFGAKPLLDKANQIVGTVPPNIGIAFANTVATFIGTWAGGTLARALIDGNPQAMSMGSSLGGAVGGAVAGAIVGNSGLLFGMQLGAIAGPIGILIGAFVGALVGGLLGGVISPNQTPQGAVELYDDNSRTFAIGGVNTTFGALTARTVYAKGPDAAQAVDRLGETALAAARNLATALGVRLVDIPTFTYGYRGRSYFVQDNARGLRMAESSDAAAIVERGVVEQFRQGSVVGGDHVARMALKHTDATTLQGLHDDILRGGLYATWRDNPALFERALGIAGQDLLGDFGDSLADWQVLRGRLEAADSAGGLDLDAAYEKNFYRGAQAGEVAARNPSTQILIADVNRPTGAPEALVGFDLAEMTVSVPLIALDLNGDGVVVLSAADSGVLFDIDGDGWREQTAWLSPFDAFLVRDLNGDGDITSIAEMVTAGGQGIAAASLDANGNAKIDPDDPAFWDLRLWTDRNLNGGVDFGELWSLTRFGIWEIALFGDVRSEGVNEVADGSRILLDGAYGVLRTVDSGDSNPNLGTAHWSAVVSLAHTVDGIRVVRNTSGGGGQQTDDWLLVEHEGGSVTAFGAGDGNLALSGQATTARTLMAGEGNDSLVLATPAGAGPGSPGVTADGRGGNDTIIGTAADDVLTGGDGIDSLDGAAGDDVVVAGDGDDLVSGVRGGDGFDVLVIEGSVGRTHDLAGTGFEVALGGSGADALRHTGAAAVILGGGDGTDTLTGGAGGDRLEGDAGSDSLFGDAGDDMLVGGEGADTLLAGAGDDVVAADAVDLASGVVSGGDGADHLLIDDTTDVTANAAELGFEQVSGGAGHDLLIVGLDGLARGLDGGEGEDTLRSGIGADTLDGGTGADMASFADATAAITVNLGTSARTGAAALDEFTSIEGVIGTDFADTLIGSSDDNVLEGGAGGDSLDGGSGVDIVSYRGSSAAVTINLNANSFTGGDAAGDSLTGFEGIVGSAFADRLTGNASSNTIEGGAGADTLNGGTGVDVVSYAHAAAGVTLDLSRGLGLGGDGLDDALSGFEGVQGSRFNDAFLDQGAAFAYDGGAGHDRLSYAAASGAVIVDLALGAGDANFEGASKGDTYRSIEEIEGSAFADTLLGGAGYEILIGGAGDDSLNAGAGGGELRGGLAQDSYGFGRGSGVVVVQENGGIDTLVLGSGITFSDLVFLSVEDTSSGMARIDFTIGLRNPVSPYASADALADRIVIRDAASEVGRVEAIRLGDGTEFWLQVTGPNSARLVGGDGRDLLVGGAGDDTLDGAAGDDWLWGGEGNDSLLGGDGDDTLVGNEGDDTLFGGPGDDLLDGGPGDDLLIGGDGNDTLLGGYGNDTLLGGPGNDVLDGGPGNNTLDGGAGFDIYRQRAGGYSVVRDADGQAASILSLIPSTRWSTITELRMTAAKPFIMASPPTFRTG